MLRFAIPLALLATTAGRAQEPALYRAEFVQAAPGRLMELVEFYRSSLPRFDAAGEARPLVMRHSQGDRWDLLVLVPLGGDASAYLSAAREASRSRAGLGGPEREARWRDLVAWHEELYVQGPSLDAVTEAFAGVGLAHIEIFQALAGHYGDLKTEREMEAAFNRYVGRARLLLFERDPSLGGAPWDMFTIDTYRDLQHYAESSAISPEAGDAAARRAGFENSASIGPTMRRHINLHHDTITGIIR